MSIGEIIIESERKGRLSVDLYDSAYGPSLRIATKSEDALLFLRDLFKTLADQKKDVIGLHNEERMVLQRCTFVFLHVSPECKITKISTTVDEFKVCVSWWEPPIGWRDCQDFIEVLLRSGGPGHQYLTGEPGDPIIVEVSYRE